MDTSSNYQVQPAEQPERSNKLLIKSVIMGGLILAMLIPTLLISGLVSERQARQSQVVAEVGERWAGEQVLSGPYIHLPYKVI